MGCRDKPGNDNEAQPFHSVIAGLVPATHARCKHQRIAYLASGRSSPVPKDCGEGASRFQRAEENLRRIDPGSGSGYSGTPGIFLLMSIKIMSTALAADTVVSGT